jgi:hypothetical protein
MVGLIEPMAESIERQAAEIRKRLAFLKMIEQVLATTAPAAAKKRTLELGMRRVPEIA